MTTNLLFGKTGIHGYFTHYVTKEIPESAIESGWVRQAFDDRGQLAWFLDEEGQVVNQDLQGFSLERISLHDFLSEADADQSETDNEQWSESFLEWASDTPFDSVVVYRD